MARSGSRPTRRSSSCPGRRAPRASTTAPTRCTAWWWRAACCATPTAPLRGRELPPAGARDQRLDPRANLIADLPHALDGLVLGVGERPVLVGYPGHDRARRAAAHGDEHVGARDQVGRQATRPGVAELDVQLAHDLRDRGMDPLRGLGAGRERARRRRGGESVEERRRHLRAAGVLDAREQHGLARHASQSSRGSLSRCRIERPFTMKITISAMLVAWSPTRSRYLETKRSRMARLTVAGFSTM